MTIFGANSWEGMLHGPWKITKTNIQHFSGDIAGIYLKITVYIILYMYKYTYIYINICCWFDAAQNENFDGSPEG